MERIIMLGTGHAMTVECFNTCFVLESEQGRLLVDTGGGQQVLGQLRRAGISVEDLDCVFVSHRHTDHLLGLPWLVRARLKGGKPLEVIAHKELCGEIAVLLGLLFPELGEKLGGRVILTSVEAGEKLDRCGRTLTFHRAENDRCAQFGFVMPLSGGGTFAFNGDVPFHESNRERMEGAKYLMHEAFCLMEENGGRGHPGHSTVARAGEIAAGLNAENLILIHGSDRDIAGRKARYTAEAARFFKGPIFVPDDLDIIELA